MGLSFNPIKNIGSVISGVGTAMNLPEFGFSEKLTGNKVNNAGGYPSWSQTGANLASSVYNNPSVSYSQGSAGGGGVQQGNTGGTDQPQYSSGGGYGTSGGRSGGATFDPASLIEAQDALRQANWYLGQLDPQRQIFLNNLSQTYADYRNKLGKQHSQNEADYRQSQTTANQNRVSANNTIDGKVRQRANSLQRLMGAYGAGDSEAAQMYAPYAAARTGSQLRNQVNQQYGQTMQGLDTDWRRYEGDYNQSLADLEKQRSDQESAKMAEFLQRQYDLENQKRQAEAAVTYAQGGNAAAARAAREAALPRMYQLLQEITALGAQKPTPTVADVNYTAKPVEQFTVADPGDIQGVDPAMADTTSPYYQWLLRQKEADNNFFGY